MKKLINSNEFDVKETNEGEVSKCVHAFYNKYVPLPEESPIPKVHH